jgi:hypothetical protein
MIVFSNHRVGPSAELLVSPEVATAILRTTAKAASPLAQGRWERELVLWLEHRATRGFGRAAAYFDVGDIAWSPEHFEHQRRFLVDAIQKAALTSEHARPLRLWARLIEAHPRDSVVVGHRWLWPAMTQDFDLVIEK